MTGDYRFEIFGSCEKVYPRMRLILGAIRANMVSLEFSAIIDPAEVRVGISKDGRHMLIK